MDQFRIAMTFSGSAEGENWYEAVQAFKRELGIAPESMRPMVRMTDLEVRLLLDVNPDDPGGVVMAVYSQHSVKGVPEDDAAVPAVPSDADLPVVEHHALGDDADATDP